jgi:hypothetical protein
MAGGKNTGLFEVSLLLRLVVREKTARARIAARNGRQHVWADDGIYRAVHQQIIQHHIRIAAAV